MVLQIGYVIPALSRKSIHVRHADKAPRPPPKDSVNTTITPVPDDQNDDDESCDPPRKASPSKDKLLFDSDILLACLAVSLPMILLSVTTLYLVFRYRVSYTPCPVPELCGAVTSDSNIIFVDFSATNLTFVASWSSSISFTLSAVMMFLFSFPVARHIMRHSASSTHPELPTPYQVNLLIGSMAASLITLWQFLLYLTRWGKKRGPTVTPLGASITMLLFVVSLALFIQGADTWLHVAVDTINLDHYSDSNIRTPLVGHGIAPWCSNANPHTDTCQNTCATDCGLNIRNSSTIFSTIGDISATHKVFTVDTNPVKAVLGPANLTSGELYSADTYMATTTCIPITDRCKTTDVNDLAVPPDGQVIAGARPLPFNCSAANGTGIDFTGNTQVSFNLKLSSTSQNQSELSTAANKYTNPFTWAVAANVDMNEPRSDSTTLQASANFTRTEHNGIGRSYIVACNTTIWNASYTFAATSPSAISVINVTLHAPTNASVSGIVTESWFQSQLANPQLQSAWQLAYAGATTAQQYADNYATRVSQIAMAYLAGQTELRNATMALRKETRLVSTVPRNALYTLVAANLLFAAVGLVLTALAIVSCTRDVKEVQTRLSVPGLVAELFEKPYCNKQVKGEKELFREGEGLGHSRVFIEKEREGGFKYDVWF